MKAAVGPGQSLAAWLVLAVLVLLAAWVGVRQEEFNPAVLTALSAPASGRGGGAASALAGLLPSGVEGFSPVGGPESFGPDTLPDKIDGKAELYLAANFREMACQRLTAGPGGLVEVFLYQMAEPTDAFSVFSAQRRPGSQKSDLTGSAYLAGNALFLATGPYYAEFVAEAATPETPARLAALARDLLARLPKSEEAANESALLPREGLAADTLTLLASDAFGMQGLGGVYCATYALASGEATGFISRRASPQEATALAADYAAFLLSMGAKELKPEALAGLPQGARLIDALGDVDLVFAVGPYLAGAHAAASPAAALELGRSLAESLAKSLAASSGKAPAEEGK